MAPSYGNRSPTHPSGSPRLLALWPSGSHVGRANLHAEPSSLALAIRLSCRACKPARGIFSSRFGDPAHSGSVLHRFHPFARGRLAIRRIPAQSRAESADSARSAGGVSTFFPGRKLTPPPFACPIFLPPTRSIRHDDPRPHPLSRCQNGGVRTHLPTREGVGGGSEPPVTPGRQERGPYSERMPLTLRAITATHLLSHVPSRRHAPGLMVPRSHPLPQYNDEAPPKYDPGFRLIFRNVPSP